MFVAVSRRLFAKLADGHGRTGEGFFEGVIKLAKTGKFGAKCDISDV